MNKTIVKVFENERFGKLRGTMINNEPWWVAKDVALALGYADAGKAVRTHVYEDDRIGGQNALQCTIGDKKCTIPPIIDSLGRERYPIWINESGLYSLVLSSKLNEAKEFAHWVTHEVLPSIRKHGAYVTDELLANGDKLNQTMEELKAEHTLRIKAERENDELRLRCDTAENKLAVIDEKNKARVEKLLATNKAKREAESLTSAQVLVAMARRISMRMYHNDFRHGTNAFYKTIICNGIDLYGRREEWQKTHTAKSGNAPKLYEFIREDEAAVCINAVANYFNRIDFTDLVVKHNKAA